MNIHEAIHAIERLTPFYCLPSELSGNDRDKLYEALATVRIYSDDLRDLYKCFGIER